MRLPIGRWDSDRRGLENRQKPVNALVEGIQPLEKLLMKSQVFKSHSINNAVGPKSTHFDTRSYDIISVFLLKAFRHPMWDE